MIFRSVAVAIFAAVSAAGAALAQSTAPGAPKAPDEVVVRAPDQVVVHAPIDPKVVSTFPADGGKAAGGVIVLKIVFDQPMVPLAWSFAKADGGAFPNCLARPRLLNDTRSFALLCTVAQNQAYALQINASPDFVSARGRSAAPYLLRFSTTGTTVYDMHAALVQAGLTDADDPIMSWNGQVGLSRAAAPAAPP
jgi:hypothetical protein